MSGTEPEVSVEDVMVLLAADITAAATSFDVTTARGALPSGETFWLKIDNEIMKVEANTSGALSEITRGVEGTTAAPHVTTAPAYQVVGGGEIQTLTE